jgi:hypothetical protein
MVGEPLGSVWLQQHFNLTACQITHNSFIGQREKIELAVNGDVGHTFGPKYAPRINSPLAHVEFAIKYDHLNLDFLKAVFDKIEVEDVSEYISPASTGKYSRKIGYLYEWLTGKKVSLTTPMSGNYNDLLEKDRYITGKVIKNSRWRINDNLLGTQEFCPIVRRTIAIDWSLKIDLKAHIEKLKGDYSPDIFTGQFNIYIGKRQNRLME